ncbi:hypothetical protein [Streptomyces sp. NPDC002845]
MRGLPGRGEVNPGHLDALACQDHGLLAFGGPEFERGGRLPEDFGAGLVARVLRPLEPLGQRLLLALARVGK